MKKHVFRSKKERGGERRGVPTIINVEFPVMFGKSGANDVLRYLGFESVYCWERKHDIIAGIYCEDDDIADLIRTDLLQYGLREETVQPTEGIKKSHRKVRGGVTLHHLTDDECVSIEDVCAICLEGLRARDGQALITAECSHTFHYSCIASSVQHGNHICPTCRSKWTNLLSQFTPSTSTIPPPPPNNNFRIPIYQQPVEIMSLNFADDEPLLSPEPNTSSTDSITRRPQVNIPQTKEMTVNVLPERPAMSRSDQSDSFSVLVGIRAPPLSPEASDRPDARAPVDLVAVLDVSGSMNGEKIRLLKEAMGFVVDNLGPSDRLSVITFSTTARRVTPLRTMADTGRADAIQAINSLRVTGATNILAELKMAVQVLEQRRQKNPVASIILLSDGQDNQNGNGDQFLQSLRHLPFCIRANAADQDPTVTDIVPVPVHTFGFGSDHDATALHAIADGSGETFSYIESIEIIQDAFARCIGGLLSVVAQQLEIRVQTGAVPRGIQIQSISSGRYRNTVDNDANQHGVVYIGDVYSEEVKQFLVNLSIPQETDSLTTKLLEVKYSYTDPISNQSITTDTIIVEIRRPTTENLSEEETQVCVEVDRERNRISIAEGIAQAQTMADRGEFEGARVLLACRRISMMGSSSAQAGDTLSGLLDDEVREIERGMTNRVEYDGGGKAFASSKMSSHMYQRASTQARKSSGRSRSTKHSAAGTSDVADAVSYVAGLAGFGAAPAPEEVAYQTTFMRRMVQKSQNLRQSGNIGDKSGGSSNSN